MRGSGKKQMRIFPILEGIFGFIGVIMVVVAVVWMINARNFVENAVVVEASITNIEAFIDNDGDADYTVYVKYHIDGNEYKNIQLSEYTSSMYEGKEVEVYVNRENHREARLKSLVYLEPIIFAGIGVLLFAVVIIVVIIDMKGRKRKKRLLETGIKVYGEVTGGAPDYNYTVSGKHPYRFECRYMDTYSGQPVICTSDRTWENPEAYVGQQVLIYLDRDNKSKYYVELDSVFSN